MKRFWALSFVVATIGCSGSFAGTDSANADNAGGNGNPHSGDNSGNADSGTVNDPDVLPPKPPVTSGTIALTLKSLGAAQADAPVFTGIPFSPGALVDPEQIALFDGGQPLPRQIKLLSKYPDGSARVVLVGTRVTLSANQTKPIELRYGGSPGAAPGAPLTWARNRAVLFMAPPSWYGSTPVFNLEFTDAASDKLFPAFEQRLPTAYKNTSDPPDSTNPDVRNYYDHTHALYTTLLRTGGPNTVVSRIYEEVTLFRESEILHTGAYIGQYRAGTKLTNASPMVFDTVRRMFVQGMLDDYYFSGDVRSLEVAKEMGEAYLVDSTKQGARFTWTERIPAWEIMGMTSLYQATQEPRYLDAAMAVAKIELDHQDAMAKKYPNQGKAGVTGAFVQDRDGQWYDPDESESSGAGSSFMTALLSEAMIRLYWVSGDTRVRAGVLKAVAWLVDSCYVPAEKSFRYVCGAADNTDTTPSLNPMWLEMLGFGYQSTGEAKYLTTARAIMEENDWGNHIKEFNQAMRTTGHGIYLLSAPAKSVRLTLK